MGIACEVVYADDPVASLNNTYSTYNHQIKSLCSSITTDMDPNTSLETRYIICDCSTESVKRLVVAFRGSFNSPDVFADLNILPADKSVGYGMFHGGYSSRSQCIPLDHAFVELIKSHDGYQIVFTGHSMGGAIAAILAYNLLQDRRLQQDISKVQFIGFGVPLFGSASFNSEIDRKGWKEKFHFHVNRSDIVPRAISILSQVMNNIISKGNIENGTNNEVITNVCKYIGMVSSVLGFGKVNMPLVALKEVGIPIFKFLLTSLKELISIVEKTYVPFGKHYLIDYDYENNQTVTECNDLYGVGANFSLKELFSEKQIEALQCHRMNNYMTEVIEMCKEHCSIMNSPGRLFGLWHGNTKKEKKAENNSSFRLSFDSSDKKPGESDDNFMNKTIQFSKKRLIKNDSSIDLRLSITTNPSEYSNYITNVIVTSPQCTYSCRKDEGDGTVTYCLNGVLSDFIDIHGDLKKKEIQVIICTHFNTIQETVSIADIPIEKGQSIKQEKISKLSADLLYMYALSFIFATKKVTTIQKIVDQRKEIETSIKDLDKLGEGETLDIDLKTSADFYSYLLSMFFEENQNDTSQVNELFTENTDLKFTDRMKSLIGSDTFLDIIENKFPSVLHHSKRLTFPIKETFTETIGGIVSSLSAICAAALLFAPGVNLMVAGGWLGVSLLIAFGFAGSAAKKTWSDYNYDKNLKTIISSIEGLNYSASLPTPYHFEKLIFDWSRTENGIFKQDDDNYILSNWASFFKTGSTLAYVKTENQAKVLKIIRNICINYQLRKALMENYHVGVVGMKKCGKTTFIDKLLHTSSRNASSFIATTEIKAYPLSDDIPFFAFWDYPHYESQNVSHKFQFITSRFLMDYVIVIYNSETEADTTTMRSHIKLIKHSSPAGFTILMNKADTVWCEEFTGQILQEKKELARRNLNLPESENFVLEYCSLNSKEEKVSKLKECGILLMPQIRKRIWEELTKTKLIPEDYRLKVEEKWMELGKKDLQKVIISFYRGGKKSKLEFKWEKISKMTFEQVLEDLVEEFEFEFIYIYAKESREEIKSMISLFEHPEHEFDVYNKQM